MAGHKSLKDTLKDNPTALGDPVSLKTETSNTEPTEHDRPFKSDSTGGQAAQTKPVQKSQQNDGGNSKKSLKELAESKNPSMLGDPTSLKAETSNRDPVKDGQGNEDGTGRSGGTAKQSSSRDSKL
jgi:hypothetical protein